MLQWEEDFFGEGLPGSASKRGPGGNTLLCVPLIPKQKAGASLKFKIFNISHGTAGTCGKATEIAGKVVEARGGRNNRLVGIETEENPPLLRHGNGGPLCGRSPSPSFLIRDFFEIPRNR